MIAFGLSDSFCLLLGKRPFENVYAYKKDFIEALNNSEKFGIHYSSE